MPSSDNGSYRAMAAETSLPSAGGLNMKRHMAQKKRWSAKYGRTTCHESYRACQKVRKRVESIFWWMKTVGGSVGVERAGLYGELAATAYNLVRMSSLIAEV